MSDAHIHKLTMPKWGLTMTQGRVVKWLFEENAEVVAGSEVVDIETEKIAGAAEAPVGGVLRRRVAKEGEVVPVSGLLGVITGPGVSEDRVDRFVQAFVSTFVPEEAEGPAPEKVVLAGRPLRYLRRGDAGDPVVLVHGFGGDLNNWLFNHEALASDRAVYALDLPGHGGSSKDVGDGTVGSLAGVVAGFMDALGLPAAHLVGHSLGGAVVAELSFTEPRRVRSLALISSLGLGPEFNTGFLCGFVRARRRREIRPVLESLFADPALVTRRLVDDVLRHKRLDGVDDALRAIADQIVSDGRQVVAFRERLAKYPGPALVIWGAADQIVPPAHAGGLPDAVRVEVIAGAGHMLMMEASAQVIGLLGALLHDSRTLWGRSMLCPPSSHCGR